MSLLQYFGLALIGIITGTIIWVYRKVTYWDRKGVPNTGFFFQFFGYKNRKSVEVEVELRLKYGPIFGYYQLFKPILVIGSEDHLKDILIKDFSKFRNHSDFGSVHPFIDMHLFFLNDEQWKKMRAVISPMFSSGKLKSMAESIFPCVDNFISSISKLNSLESTKKYLDCLLMDVIVSCAYGVKIDCLNDPNNEILLQTTAMFNAFSSSMGIFGSRFADLSCFDYISKLTMDLLTQRRKENLESPNSPNRGDFLQVMVDAKYNPDGPTLTDDQICAFGISFFSDGYETTSKALTALFYYLAKNESAHKKLYDEVSKVKELNVDTVGTLKYLDAVVKESFRLWPPTFWTDRLCDEDYILAGTNITIPAGMTVQIPVFAIHRDPKIFPNPDEFNPERFLDGGGNEDAYNQLTLLTFGAGPRICVGQKFATLSIKLTVARMITKIRFEATPETKMENITGKKFFVISKDVFLKVIKR